MPPLSSEEAKLQLDAVISNLLELTRTNDDFLISASVARLEILRDQYLIPRLDWATEQDTEPDSAG